MLNGGYRRFGDNLPIPPCVTHENGAVRLSQNVGNYQSTLRNISEERGGSSVSPNSVTFHASMCHGVQWVNPKPIIPITVHDCTRHHHAHSYQQLNW